MVRVAIDFGDKSGPETITMRTIPMLSFAITRAGGTQAQMPQVPGPGSPGAPGSGNPAGAPPGMIP
jgi:hypothetical protein